MSVHMVPFRPKSLRCNCVENTRRGDIITNNTGFTTVSVGARLPQKCLVKKLYVPNCMIAWTLFFPLIPHPMKMN